MCLDSGSPSGKASPMLRQFQPFWIVQISKMFLVTVLVTVLGDRWHGGRPGSCGRLACDPWWRVFMWLLVIRVGGHIIVLASHGVLGKECLQLRFLL